MELISSDVTFHPPGLALGLRRVGLHPRRRPRLTLYLRDEHFVVKQNLRNWQERCAKKAEDARLSLSPTPHFFSHFSRHLDLRTEEAVVSPSGCSSSAAAEVEWGPNAVGPWTPARLAIKTRKHDDCPTTTGQAADVGELTKSVSKPSLTKQKLSSSIHRAGDASIAARRQ